MFPSNSDRSELNGGTHSVHGCFLGIPCAQGRGEPFAGSPPSTRSGPDNFAQISHALQPMPFLKASSFVHAQNPKQKKKPFGPACRNLQVLPFFHNGACTPANQTARALKFPPPPSPTSPEKLKDTEPRIVRDLGGFGGNLRSALNGNNWINSHHHGRRLVGQWATLFPSGLYWPSTEG